jgi:translation initiation factor 2B subunit (eIF-2B alpha/beta/delta family)
MSEQGFSPSISVVFNMEVPPGEKKSIDQVKDEPSADRWARWFPENNNYAKILRAICDIVEKKDSEAHRDYFTPHGSAHCLAVEKMIKALINKSHINLSNLDKFILFIAAWTHDLGMLESVGKKYNESVLKKDEFPVEERRRLHDKISAWFLLKNEEIDKIFKENKIKEDIFRNIIYLVNYISQYHRRSTNIRDCNEFRSIRDNKIQALLLASLLRLGDTLHKDYSRFEKELFEILQIGDFDRSARLHWLKSYVVSSIDLNIDKQSIHIEIALPEFDDNEKVDMEESIKRLEFIITEDILEDVLAVKDIFKAYRLPFYDSVKTKIYYVPGFVDNMKQDIKDILNDLDILLSPNTSAVINKAFKSIITLSNKRHNSYELYYKQVKQLLHHLMTIKVERPCHIGLGKIVGKIKEVFDSYPDSSSTPKPMIGDKPQKLTEWAEKEINARNNAIKAINDKAEETLQGKENIILFGFSDMVKSFLKRYREDNKANNNINFYILEGRGKNRYSFNNNIEYSDGLHYAHTLIKIGFKRNTILPESSLSALINDKTKNIQKDNTLVLFGANGVDEKTHDVGHTSGHKLVAMTAKYYNIPVVVIADMFKFGHMPWGPQLKRKGNNWFSGDKEFIDQLEEKEITLLNYREDKLEFKFIERIINENNNIINESYFT